MPVEQILTNARIVTAEQEFVGTLVLRDGLIAQVEEGVSGLPQAQNLGGDYLLPGLVELHTDNLERHIEPRPKVSWPHAAAIIAHDAELASTGITTVFDALRVGSVTSNKKAKNGYMSITNSDRSGYQSVDLDTSTSPTTLSVSSASPYHTHLNTSSSSASAHRGHRSREEDEQEMVRVRIEHRRRQHNHLGARLEVAAEPLHLIREHRVSHMCGAPIVLNALVNMPESAKAAIEHPVNAMVAGAAPPAKVIGAVEEMGIKVTHVYGLTEVYGPVTVCAWHAEWDELALDERARIKSRQGVRYATLEGLMVGDPKTLEPTPRDGETIGEIFMRGNTVMKGYLKNPSATAEAFEGGWFHTGDLAVCHPDGYVEIRDRLKDIIISGGENISTIEVEGVLYRHPAVLEAAVVARPDEKWGETPCAFITLKTGQQASDSEIMTFCREHLAGFKVPKTVVFTQLPKTSTGKIQKFVLRDMAKAL